MKMTEYGDPLAYAEKALHCTRVQVVCKSDRLATNLRMAFYRERAKLSVGNKYVNVVVTQELNVVYFQEIRPDVEVKVEP